MKIVLILGALTWCLNGGAQTILEPPVQPAIVSQGSTNQVLVLPSPPVAAGVIGGRPNVADIIGSPPPAVGNTFGGPILIAPQLAGYLPRADTNPAIGVAYPPGSPEFVMMMAGITPPSPASNAPPAAQNAIATVPSFTQPLVTYQLAPPGPKRQLLLREAENDQVRDFPPGTVIRGMTGSAAQPQPPTVASRTVIAGNPEPARIPVVPLEGPEVVREFPPGAVLVRSGQPVR